MALDELSLLSVQYNKIVSFHCVSFGVEQTRREMSWCLSLKMDMSCLLS